ncbi:MAG: hypothetical protein HY901_35045, partial [Deltaproteobacteria bacterium]|nr:hypothetical protein [Deltaproteobacteria bacterium]
GDSGGGHCKCVLGFAWNGTECGVLCDCSCVGADCDKLDETLEACQARHLSCSTTPQLTCGAAQLHQNTFDACPAMDASAVGDGPGTHCLCILGFAWNGAECVELADCACQGTDCDKLEATLEACQARHSGCP